MLRKCLDCAFAFFDDIFAVGEGGTFSEAEVHTRRLVNLQERVRAKPESFRCKLKEVPYVGHQLTSEGLLMEETKVKATKALLPPSDVKKVRRLVTMANFFSRFMCH